MLPQPSRRHAATARINDPPVPPQVLPCAGALAAFFATLLLASAAAFWLGAQPAAEALIRSLLAPSAAPSTPLSAEEEPGESIDGEPINGKSSRVESLDGGTTGVTEAAAASAFGSASFLLEENASVPRILEFDLVKTYPHDNRAFTQGLLYADHEASGGRGTGEGVFYESTGEYGRSTVREVDVASGEVLNSVPQSDDVFGEGLALHDNRLYQLAWRVQKGLVYDRDTLQPRGSFQHGMADGWGLSVLNESIMVGTDGSSTLFHLDSSSFKAVARVTVKDGKRSIPNLNELEVVGGLVWANVWLSTCLAAIHPDTGKVLAWLDLSSLQRLAHARSNELNAHVSGLREWSLLPWLGIRRAERDRMGHQAQPSIRNRKVLATNVPDHAKNSPSEGYSERASCGVEES
ncbi:unnamed protein product [Closterium sp. Naga37s-1]|nr:unnamed protein product [Closterium sp. Naga37s-1]